MNDFFHWTDQNTKWSLVSFTKPEYLDVMIQSFDKIDTEYLH